MRLYLTKRSRFGFSKSNPITSKQALRELLDELYDVYRVSAFNPPALEADDRSKRAGLVSVHRTGAIVQSLEQAVGASCNSCPIDF
jgi:hypothetical protein